MLYMDALGFVKDMNTVD